MKPTNFDKSLHAIDMAKKFRRQKLPGMSDSPQYVAAWIAHDSPLWCDCNDKTWNSRQGTKAYREVLAILLSSGLVAVSWKE